jgi:sporulation protein YlmC with PRC-barrel domain
MNKFETENKTGVNHSGVNPNYPTKFLTAASIIGDMVVSPQDEKLGSIKDMMIDLRSGKIEYVIIELGGILGIGEKYFAIPFSHLKLDSKNERFTLTQPKEILEKAPGFDKAHWPETNTHMFDSSGAYWGGFMGANTGTPY